MHLELTTRRVIVTSWVDGVKLSSCDSEDVLELCDSLLNCYLYQLLDTGFLHADPHPGNLLRTPDGRLCILDFGLVSEVDPEKRIHLVEYIANLTMEDWDGLTQNLVALEFLPKGMTQEELQQITPVMKEVMGKLVTGGTGGISMGSLSLQLEGVARRYKMVVPPYFALVLRAFSVIEGIAMQHNGNYRIVGSCMPYLAQRLLGDGHPRMQAALKRMLCGRGDRLEVERLRRLLEALSEFRTEPREAPATDALTRQHRPSPAAEIWGSAVVDDGVKQVLRSVFSKRGTLMQVRERHRAACRPRACMHRTANPHRWRPSPSAVPGPRCDLHTRQSRRAALALCVVHMRCALPLCLQVSSSGCPRCQHAARRADPLRLACLRNECRCSSSDLGQDAAIHAALKLRRLPHRTRRLLRGAGDAGG